jgi:hypothetical protein
MKSSIDWCDFYRNRTRNKRTSVNVGKLHSLVFVFVFCKLSVFESQVCFHLSPITLYSSINVTFSTQQTHENSHAVSFFFAFTCLVWVGKWSKHHWCNGLSTLPIFIVSIVLFWWRSLLNVPFLSPEKCLVPRSSVVLDLFVWSDLLFFPSNDQHRYRTILYFRNAHVHMLCV